MNSWAGLDQWDEAGVNIMGDLYVGGELAPFCEIVEEGVVPAGLFLMPGKILGKIRACWRKGKEEPTEHTCMKYLYLINGKIKAITLLYRTVFGESGVNLNGLR